MGIDYIKHRQAKLDKKRRRLEELRLKEESERVAKMEAEAREREERAYQKKRLLEKQENERLRKLRIQKEKIIAQERLANQCSTLVAEIKDHARIDNALEEMRVIIQNHEPSLQALDWENWLLSDPLNQRLAELDLELAMELFKRDNLLAKRRHGTRGKKTAADKGYVLTFTGDVAVGARFDYVSTTFNPDSYDGAGTGLNRGFTVSYWVKSLEDVSESPDVYIAWGKRSQADGAFQFGVKNENRIKIGVGSGDKDGNTHNENNVPYGGTVIPHGVNDGEWHHWAVTYGGDDHPSIGGDRQVRVWVDGVEFLKNNATGGHMGVATWNDSNQNCDEGCDNPANDASYIYFGGRANWNGLDDDPPTTYNQGWACALSEVAIYNVEKDEDGTFANVVYNAGFGYDHRINNNLVGYWKFNEGSGTTVKDYGPYGKHGTLTSDADQGGSGTPTWEEIKNYR